MAIGHDDWMKLLCRELECGWQRGEKAAAFMLVVCSFPGAFVMDRP